MSKTKITGWIARSNLNSKYILCTNGQFEHEDYIGPGTKLCARVYKLKANAEKVRGGAVTVEYIEE